MKRWLILGLLLPLAVHGADGEAEPGDADTEQNQAAQEVVAQEVVEQEVVGQEVVGQEIVAQDGQPQPASGNLKNRRLGDAFKNFRPSEEISADNAVAFPVDI